MASRARRRTIRDPEKRPTFIPKYIDTLTENQAQVVREITNTPVLNDQTIKKINAFNYVNQFYPQLENFLDFYYNRFYKIIDMITDGIDIIFIVAHAKSLTEFTKREIESLNYIPGTDGLIVELYQCEELLIDIIDDIIKGVEPPLIKQRLEFMKRLLNKVTNKFS
jgi:hypothetical protein